MYLCSIHFVSFISLVLHFALYTKYPIHYWYFTLLNKHFVTYISSVIPSVLYILYLLYYTFCTQSYYWFTLQYTISIIYFTKTLLCSINLCPLSHKYANLQFTLCILPHNITYLVLYIQYSLLQYYSTTNPLYSIYSVFCTSPLLTNAIWHSEHIFM